MKNYSEITFKYLRVQKKRTIFTILGIALSVGLITAIGTMGMSLRDKLIRQAIANTGDYHVSFSKVSGKDINKIKNNVEVQSTGITDKEGTGIISDFSAKEKEMGMAEIPHRYLNIKGYGGSALEMFSTNLREGRMPKTSKEITLDYWALKYLPGNPKIGDKIKMTIGIRKDLTGAEMDESSMSSDEVFDKTGEKEYTIVGLLEPKVFVSTAYMANGITGIDNIGAFEGKNYNVFIKMNSLNNIQNKTPST